MLRTRRFASASALVAVAVALAAAMLAGCGGGDGGKAASVSVAITDADSLFSKVHLTVQAVRLVPAGHESEATGPTMPLVAALDPAKGVDIDALAYKQQALGTGTVAAGRYTQVRLVLARNAPGEAPANSVTLKSDPTRSYALGFPAGEAGGLKLSATVTVPEGASALVLDFDPTRAIVHDATADTYTLKSSGLRVGQASKVLASYGTLSMTLAPAATWPSARVELRPKDKTNVVAWGGVSKVDGTFRAFLPAGDYTIRLTATGHKTEDTAKYTPPSNFTITVGADRALGSVTMTAL